MGVVDLLRTLDSGLGSTGASIGFDLKKSKLPDDQKENDQDRKCRAAIVCSSDEAGEFDSWHIHLSSTINHIRILLPFLGSGRTRNPSLLISASPSCGASQVKSAIFSTLIVIIRKGGIFLKPFLPQLQTTFLKCLQDSTRTVHSSAVVALGKLSVQTRVDPLVGDLLSSLQHVPKTNVEIPSANEEIRDHQRLLDRSH